MLTNSLKETIIQCFKEGLQQGRHCLKCHTRQFFPVCQFDKHRNKLNGINKNRSGWDIIDHKGEPVYVGVCVCVFIRLYIGTRSDN